MSDKTIKITKVQLEILKKEFPKIGMPVEPIGKYEVYRGKIDTATLVVYEGKKGITLVLQNSTKDVEDRVNKILQPEEKINKEKQKIIEIDDSGWGDIVGGVFIVGCDISTDNAVIREIPVEFFQGNTFRKKLYKDEAVRCVEHILKTLNAHPEDTVIHICRGTIFSKVYLYLNTNGYDFECFEIVGKTQKLAENAFNNYLSKIGCPRGYYQMKKWLSDNEDRIKYAKTGWGEFNKMIKRIIITDLARMKEPNVCIFGIDEHNEGIRPVIPYSGISEKYAIENSILPFNEIEFDLTKIANAEPPHIEDWKINRRYKPKFIRKLSNDEANNLLSKISYKCVKDIFEAEIHENRYLNAGCGKRSIGTIKVKKILFVDYSPKCLFSWSDVPGKDNKQLLEFLKDDLKIEWIENAEIKKSRDNETMTITNKNKNSELITIKLNKTEKNVILEISDGGVYEYNLKEENGKLNIYLPEKFNYRIKFIDQSGEIYDLPVTDLAFRYYCDDLRKKGKNTKAIGLQINQDLKECSVFLRIGLARLFKNKHYLQITGVYDTTYTFLNYFLDRKICMK